MIEKLLGGVGLLVCLALLLRMALPPARQAAFDAFWRRRWQGLRGLGLRLRHARRRRTLAREQAAPGAHASDAAREAEAAIERARRAGVDRDGNVYRPKSFKGPRKPH